MRRIHRTALLFLALALAASAASAGNPFYLTGKLGYTSLDADLGDSFSAILDDDDNSWGLGVGFRLGDYLAFQAEYHELGTAVGVGSSCPPDALCIAPPVPVEADSTTLSLSVLPQLPIGERFFLYGKFGFVSWESDVSEISDAADRFVDKFDDQDLLYGAGVRLLLPGPFGVFAEYESISGDFETVSLGATLGF